MIGSTHPDLEWETYITQTLGGELFRVTFSAHSTRSYCRVRGCFGFSPWNIDEVQPSVRVYPKNESVLLPLPLPPGYKDAGMDERWIQIKRFYYSAFGAITDPNYLVTIEEWEPEEGQITTPDLTRLETLIESLLRSNGG